MSSDNLRPLLIELGEIDEQIKALTKQRDDIKKQLGPALTKAGSIIAGDFQIEMKEVAGRRTLSKELLEEAGIDVEPFYKTGKPSVRMTIKRVNVI